MSDSNNYNPAQEGIDAVRAEALENAELMAKVDDFKAFLADALLDGHVDTSMSTRDILTMAIETFLEIHENMETEGERS